VDYCLRNIKRQPRSIILAFSLLVTSCVSAKTPYENFVAGLRAWEGKDIRRDPEFSAYRRAVLSNGNYEYRLTRPYGQGKGPCTTIYEVDPNNYKIVRSDFSGSKDDCIIPP
jgi:hypothetical protein